MKSWRTLLGAAVSLLLHVAAIVALVLLMREPAGDRMDPDQSGHVELVMEEHKGRPDAGAAPEASPQPAPQAAPAPPPAPEGPKVEPPPPAPESQSVTPVPEAPPLEQPVPQPSPERPPVDQPPVDQPPVDQAPADQAPPMPEELPPPPVEAPPPPQEAPPPPPPPPPPPAPARTATPRAPAAPPAPPAPRAPAAPPTPQAAPSAPVFDLRGDSDLNALVEGGDTIIPASPDKTQRNRPPAYPESAARRGQQGVVVVLIHVSPAGTTAGADIAQSSGYPLLDRAAIEAVMTWRFLPAVRDGQAVPFDMPMRFIFSLN